MALEVASLESVAASSLAKVTFHLAYSLLAPAAFQGFEWILRSLFSMISTTTSVNFGAGFFVNIYRYQLEIAYLLALPFLLWGALVSVYERSLASLVQTVLVRLPLVVLVAEGGLTLTSWLSHLVDAISLPLITHGESATGMITSASGLIHSRAVPGIAALLILVLGCVAALCVWIELSIRAGVLYLITAVLPLACVGLLFPPGALGFGGRQRF